MGFFLFIVLAGGALVGLAVDAVVLAITLPILVMRFRRADDRFPWPRLLLVFLAATAIAFWAVGRIPYGHVDPGSDYDVAAGNYFMGAIAYTVAPIVAYLLCFVLALTAWRPRGDDTALEA